jgi:methylenetetrahydrofolate reductase (NADPH)
MIEFTRSSADHVSPQTTEDQVRRALVVALRSPRYEVMPLAGTAEQVEEYVPADLPVTVTASPRRGLEPTLRLAETLARTGFQAVPHLAARLVRDEAHLADILNRADEARLRDVFVVAGDGEEPVGEFADASTLLSAIHRLRQSGIGQRQDQLGVAGYPEGHPFVPQDELIRVLLEKQPLSTYVVSQMCFDAPTVSAWVTRMRESGLRLPIHVGVVGVVDQRKLLRFATRIGIGTSAKFLRKHRHGVARLLWPGAYRPDPLIRQLAPDLAAPSRGVHGLHIYTLGDVAATERWRREVLNRLTSREAKRD